MVADNCSTSGSDIIFCDLTCVHLVAWLSTEYAAYWTGTEEGVGRAYDWREIGLGSRHYWGLLTPMLLCERGWCYCLICEHSWCCTRPLFQLGDFLGDIWETAKAVCIQSGIFCVSHRAAIQLPDQPIKFFFLVVAWFAFEVYHLHLYSQRWSLAVFALIPLIILFLRQGIFFF